jgi:hypothetical protein
MKQRGGFHGTIVSRNLGRCAEVARLNRLSDSLEIWASVSSEARAGMGFKIGLFIDAMDCWHASWDLCACESLFSMGTDSCIHDIGTRFRERNPSAYLNMGDATEKIGERLCLSYCPMTPTVRRRHSNQKCVKKSPNVRAKGWE